jgi:hypothetical protein
VGEREGEKMKESGDTGDVGNALLALLETKRPPSFTFCPWLIVEEPNNGMYVSANCYICVRMLLCMCPHTAIYVSACCFIYVG